MRTWIWQDVFTAPNAFRGQEVLDWFDGLQPLGVDIREWVNIHGAFEVELENEII